MFGLILRVVASFNAADCCYLYGKAVGHRVPERLSIKSVKATVKQMLAPVLSFGHSNPGYISFDALFFATTKNQYLALEPVAKALRERGLSVLWLRSEGRGAHLALSFSSLLWFYFALLSLLLSRPKSSLMSIKQVGGYRFISSFYYYFWASISLGSFGGILFFSNDHSFSPRALMKGARLVGAKTGYIQHAAVTGVFPPLEFDYAFLDGRDARQNYQKVAGVQGVPFPENVYLFGSAKMDEFFQLRSDRSFGSCQIFGLAVNALDNPLSVRECIRSLLVQKNDRNVVLRLHPRQKNINEYEAVLAEFGDRVKVVTGQSIIDYLTSVDVNLAGDSSIHLEAVASGLVSFYCDFGAGLDDYYGFVSRGLISLFDVRLFERPDIVNILQKVREEQSGALSQYFSNTGKKPFAATLIADKVGQLLADRSLS